MAERKASVSPELENKIMEVMTRNPKGVSQKIVQSSLPNIACSELVVILNTLVKQRKVILSLLKNKQIVYTWNKEGQSKKFFSSDIEEKVIFEAVQRAADTGISPRELKFALNMPQPQITKILKVLEAKKAVKSVVSKTKKKVFMVYDLEPSAAITGGNFYSGEEFDETYVNALSEQCYRYLLQAKGVAEKFLDPLAQRRASFKSGKEVYEYINSLKISKIEVDIVEIEKLLDSLVYDGKVEKNVTLTKSAGSENFYRVTKSMIPNVGLMRMPCGVCLVFNECGKDLAVSPATCVYIKEWLDF